MFGIIIRSIFSGFGWRIGGKLADDAMAANKRRAHSRRVEARIADKEAKRILRAHQGPESAEATPTELAEHKAAWAVLAKRYEAAVPKISARAKHWESARANYPGEPRSWQRTHLGQPTAHDVDALRSLVSEHAD